MDSCSLNYYTQSALKQSVKVLVQRPAFTQVRFDEGYQVLAPKPKSLRERLKIFALRFFHCNKTSSHRAKDFFLRSFPCIRWLSKYNVNRNFLADLVTGCIIACIHIPQGMGYASLIGLPPIHGVYVALFPLLVYALLGTSRHISIGNSVVVTLTVAQAVHDFSAAISTDPNLAKYKVGISEVDSENVSSNKEIIEITPYEHNSTPATIGELPVSTIIMIACTVTFLAGIFQTLMGFLHFGFLTIYLSDQLVSGYTTGAAVHVVATQLKNFFGIKIPRFHGPAKMLFTVWEVIKSWHKTNVADLFISISTVLILILFKNSINPKLTKRWKVIIPIELLVVILGTLTSYFGKLNSDYDIQIVGHIPRGLPPPCLPEMLIIPRIISNSIIVAIVSFCVTLSMSKIFAKKHNYPIDANQEIVAIGLANMFGSLFGCYAAGASMSRSSTQDSSGGKTQMCSLIACAIVLVVLLALGSLFEPLPSSVLSAIIVVSLKGMLFQFKDLKRLWYISKVDFAIWLVTFLSVITLDIDYGLAMGVGFSFFTVVIRTQRPRACVLGRVPRTDIYKDLIKYPAAEEIPGLKIFLFEASLYFANCEYFKSVLYSQTGVNPRILIAEKERQIKEKEQMQKSIKHKLCQLPCSKGCTELCPDVEYNEPHNHNFYLTDIHHIIIDCSTFSYVDSAGVDTLIQVIQDYHDVGVTVFLAYIKAEVNKMFHASGFFEKVPPEYLYLTLHDAVLHAVHTDLKVAISCDLLIMGSRYLDTDSCCSVNGVMKQEDINECQDQRLSETLENMRNELEKPDREKNIMDQVLGKETTC